MGIGLGLVGLGAFGSGFAELFKKHPAVDRIALCDREPERMKQFSELASWKDKLDPRDCYETLNDICATDLDALVVITQPWLHAPQCVQAMESGKHVYSAVPIVSLPDPDETLDWCDRLVETSRRTGQYYMLGETTYYRPEAMFCRRMAAAGAFGDFVYAEGEYCHDVDDECNLRQVLASRLASKAGREWIETRKKQAKRVKGGPMSYPTHSTAGPVCVMNAHAVKVTAYGFDNRNGDEYFENVFSNEVALYRMSNGATVRICECRELAGHLGRVGETFRVVGTAGTFSEGRWMRNFRTAPDTAKPLETSEPSVEEMRDPLPAPVRDAWIDTRTDSVNYGGHGGSHAYLVHEFVDAVANRRQPAINIWEAVRYMAMGAMAHKSALKDGERLDVPDWGDAPAS